MSLNRFTDESGKALRADYFPVRLDRRIPTPAGYSTERHRRSRSPQPRLSSSRRVRSASHKSQTPPTYMIVDYNEESRRLLPSHFNKSNNSPGSPTSHRVFTNDTTDGSLRALTPKLKRMPSKPKFLPQALKTSFVLKQKVAVEPDISTQLFNRNDVETQTIVNLQRLDLQGVRDYQTWQNEVTEPFLKELRKAIKTNKPACLEDYIIAYCEAKKSGQTPPETVYNLNSSSTASSMDQL
mmetsp:Transcript_16416/g.17762  ORF Transcript_16416/g.17762 Transcript_16416/m.17762 type:complete len:239 (-) Transcript_16416:42-758(-)